MPFVSGTYQRFYGSTGWTDDKNAAVFILASRHDTHDQDIADGINTAVGKIRLGDTMILSSVSGTNTILGALTPALSAYAYGLRVILTPANTNTGATTLNIDSKGAIAVQSIDGSACVGGELVAGIPSILVLNSAATAFIIISPANRDSSKTQARAANYTTVASDSGKYQTLGGSPVTIGVGASTAGSVIPFLSQATVTINVSTGTLYWFNGSGALVTGARTLAVGAVGTILVNAADAYIFGAGIS